MLTQKDIVSTFDSMCASARNYGTMERKLQEAWPSFFAAEERFAMDCKEFERKIPAFVANALEYKELKNFLSHVECCAECREELTIQVLISEGMARLEEGSAFDLQREMRRRMQEAEKSIRLHRMFRYIGITMEAAAVAAVILLAIVFTL